MITELVFFDLPKGTTRTQALELYRKSAEPWLRNPDLIEKYYFFSDENCAGGGVYIWNSREDAARWHGEDYKSRVRSVYGSAPRIQILDALIHVDPKRGLISEY
jgi:hypothetical protein